MIRVKHVKKYGSFFPGEISALPDAIAEEQIASRKAMRVNDDDSVVPWPEVVVDGDANTGADPDGDGMKELKDGEYKFNPETDPFVMDGLDDHTAKALHTNGIHTPGDVEAYLVSGKDLEDLDDIGKTRAKKILELYGNS